MLGRMPAETPVTLLILGAGGDLTHRLLLPGVGSLLKVEPTRKVRIIGADRANFTAAQWKSRVEDSFATVPVPARPKRSVLAKTAYRKTDVLDVDDLKALISECGDGPLVIYFALPPAITMGVCKLLEQIELPAGTRLALEKPFGSDEKTAHAFNEQLHHVVQEEQIFRVDHFLGTSTVLNLIGLRFANRILQPVWSADHIERVEIIYDEDLALEGRAGYYDGAGALKDMLQSHLLQVLGVFAMESIADLSAREVQDQKAQVLRSTHLWGTPKKASKRARYTAGSIGRRKIPAYTREKGVDPSRNTETLAQVDVEVRNNRWAGVPFTLRSGKALGTPRKQIVAYFRPVPHVPNGFDGTAAADKLIIDLKPGAVSLVLTMNAEGSPTDLEQKELRADLAPGWMLPYGEVLREILDGDNMLSVRGDAAESCWRIMDPVLKAWRSGRVPMEEYPAGSEGPEGWLPEDSVIN